MVRGVSGVPQLSLYDSETRQSLGQLSDRCYFSIRGTRAAYKEFGFKTCEIKLNLDFSFSFPIDLDQTDFHLVLNQSESVITIQIWFNVNK